MSGMTKMPESITRKNKQTMGKRKRHKENTTVTRRNFNTLPGIVPGSNAIAHYD